VCRFEVLGDGHAILRRAGDWSTLVSRFVEGELGLRDPDPVIEDAMRPTACGSRCRRWPPGLRPIPDLTRTAGPTEAAGAVTTPQVHRRPRAWACQLQCAMPDGRAVRRGSVVGADTGWMTATRKIQRSGPAIRAALAEALPDECAQFEAEFTEAFACAGGRV